MTPQKNETPICPSLAAYTDEGSQTTVRGTEAFRYGKRLPLSSQLLTPEKGPFLGIYTRTSASLVPQGFQPLLLPEKKEPSFQEIRRKRFELQAVVRRFFPSSRTAACMRLKVPDSVVGLHLHKATARAFYSGLAVCGSVWLCPVCAAKISERRRVELAAGIEAGKAKGLQVFLLTLTVPHGLGDDLPDMLEKMHKAWMRTSSNRDGKAVRAEIGLVGTVRALEVTDGANGFHPHFHALLFIDSGMTPEQVQASYTPLWRRHCVAMGLPEPSDYRGCRVDDGHKAAEYVGKWGLDHELTKGHVKKSRDPKKGKSMWDLLRDWSDKRDIRAISRFQLFAEAFRGKRQLVWSKGLRKLLGLVSELSDEELAQASVEEASLLAELEDDEWYAIRRHGLQLDLLELAEKHPERVRRFIQGVRAMIRDVGLDLNPKPGG